MKFIKVTGKITSGITRDSFSKKGGRYLAHDVAPFSPKRRAFDVLQNGLSNFSQAFHKLNPKMAHSSALAKYKTPPKFKTVNHFEFIRDNIATIPNTEYNGLWCTIPSKNGKQIPWKIHIYSDSESDWQKVYSTISGYLFDNDLAWKTIGSPARGIESLNNDTQKGKAFTIYPHSKEEFEQVARDLNQIFIRNKLQLPNSSILGDRALGRSGRLFYRYEYNSVKYKETIIDTNTPSGFSWYNSIYQGNRLANNYLASDMTILDDPWFDFDPNKYPANVR